MPATFVQENSGDTAATTAPASYAVTLGAATTLGNQLIIIIVSNATVNTPAGFALDKSQVNNDGHYVYRKATAAGETSWTVTPTTADSGCWYVAEISGLTASPLDQVISTGAGTASTTRSTGTTPTTTQADELLLASWGSSSAVNPAPSWSGETNSFVEEITDRRTTRTSGTNVGLAVASRIVAATGAYESTATASQSTTSTGILVTYKIAAVAPVGGPPTVRSVSSKGKVNVGDTSVAPTKPAGLALNDYILVLQGSDADVTLASMTATGFTQLAAQVGGTTNNWGGMKVWGKVAASGDVAASTFTFGYDGAGDGAVIMMAITAGTYDPANPITMAGSFTVQARIASAVQTVASMTGVVNALLIGLLSTDTNGTVESYPSAGMSGFTLVGSQIGIAGAPFNLAGAYSKALVAAGATGSSTVTPTGAGTSNGWSSTALIVNPLPDDGTGFFNELAA
jgi:hypothetical protein